MALCPLYPQVPLTIFFPHSLNWMVMDNLGKFIHLPMHPFGSTMVKNRWLIEPLQLYIKDFSEKIREESFNFTVYIALIWGPSDLIILVYLMRIEIKRSKHKNHNFESRLLRPAYIRKLSYYKVHIKVTVHRYVHLSFLTPNYTHRCIIYLCILNFYKWKYLYSESSVSIWSA